MPTEVILLSNIPGLGAEGDRVRVADGYARNYLFPQRLASLPEAASARHLESLRQIRVSREVAERARAEELAHRLKGLVCTIPMPSAREGKIFGGVTAAHIAETLAKQGLVFDRKQIKMDRPIHSPGEFSVTVHPHPDVTATLKVVITPTDVSLAAPKPSRPSGKKVHRVEREQRPVPSSSASVAEKPADREPAKKLHKTVKKSS